MKVSWASIYIKSYQESYRLMEERAANIRHRPAERKALFATECDAIICGFMRAGFEMDYNIKLTKG